nr:flagellar assembly protein FliH [Calidifontibacillus oryziterrae]
MSRVIKSHFTSTDQKNERVITLKPLSFHLNTFTNDIEAEEIDQQLDLEELETQKEAIIQNAEAEATNIINEAENQAQELLHQIELEKQNWEVEKEHWIETAKQEGYAEGFEIGKEQALNEYKAIVDEAKRTVELCKNDYKKNIDQSELTILHLGLKTAEKIMGFTLDLNPDAFLNLVRRVIKEARDHQDIQVHVHPAYYDLVLSQREELRALLNNPTAQLYIYPNDELETTNCIIESSFGRIDASIDSQLKEMKHKLLQVLEGEMDDEGS